MINGFKVITLCGSTRFKDEFLEAQKRLTLEGNIVISVGLFGHSGDDEVWTEGVKDMLDRQHLAKIDLADEIFVVNVGGYIGESTKREIAYAEFKCKSIVYLESCKKPGIYENYAALCELYDADRISDDVIDLAERNYKEKRKAAIAEYNSCKGPWPYQWKNIDAVVCGILQQQGLVSIDYTDLEFLYKADSVSEIRIKGKGANDEEQIQSIIDTIHNEYMDYLQSSKKLAITLSSSSNPTAYLEKIADCMSGMDVVWQTKTLLDKYEKEISIVTINSEKMGNKHQYDEWVSRVCSFLVDESSRLNVTCGPFQSKPILDKQPDVVFLGYNPHETGPVLSLEKIRERFYEGNPCFYSDERKKWSIWKPLNDIFEWAGYTKPIKDGNFIFFNAIYFGTNNIDDFKKLPNSNEIINKCLQFTGEVIQNIFKPKCVVCLSVPDCYDKLNLKFHFQQEELVNTAEDTEQSVLDEVLISKKWKHVHKCSKTVKRALWNNIPVYGIPHPSGSVSSDDMGAIALYLKSEMQKLNI